MFFEIPLPHFSSEILTDLAGVWLCTESFRLPWLFELFLFREFVCDTESDGAGELLRGVMAPESSERFLTCAIGS